MPIKNMYGIIKVWGDKYYQTVKSNDFNSKALYADHLRDEGYIVRLVFSEEDYNKILLTVMTRGFKNITDKQKEIYEAYNELLPRR